MRFGLLLLLGILAGCASPPQALFTLGAVPGATQPLRAEGIEVRRVGLAGYLDRDSIVRSAAGYQLALTGDQRWAEPLGRMLDRVLSEDLAQRLPNTPVFTESGAIGGAASLILEINVQRLDADANGDVVLMAQVALRRDGSKAAPRTSTERFTARPQGTDTAALVATMSQLIGQLTDRIAVMAASAGR
jgi:uncharacterized lipoprotein YmbA